MKLTKLLCKYLDTDGKGYVTVGNLVSATCKLAATVTIIAGYIRGVTTVARQWDGNVLSTLDVALSGAGIADTVCTLFATVGTGVILAISFSLLVAYLWTGIEVAWGVKIAKCERKDGDEHPELR